jgi:uncharacterized damage-inducible protein DinB
VAGSERDVLLYYLGRMRSEVVRVSEGLTAEQERAPGVPSGTSLLGLIRHLTWVEEHWFQRVFAGEDPGTEDSWIIPPERTRADVVAAYRAACARSDEIVLACPDLSTLSAIANPGEDERDALRVILAHMLRETARHCGHADILRERIDGTVND